MRQLGDAALAPGQLLLRLEVVHALAVAAALRRPRVPPALGVRRRRALLQVHRALDGAHHSSSSSATAAAHHPAASAQRYGDDGLPSVLVPYPEPAAVQRWTASGGGGGGAGECGNYGCGCGVVAGAVAAVAAPDAAGAAGVGRCGG